MSDILVGMSEDGACNIALRMANRHGLIAGATGTGKTITLRRIAEGFSENGVPVLLADMKGDLSGISRSGNNAKFKEIAYKLGETDFKFRAYPCRYWDVYQEAGFPVEVTLSDIGSFLLSRVLNLTRTQSGVLDLVFKISEDNKYRLHTLSDLKDVLHYMGTHIEELFDKYGTIYPSSIGVIQRAVIGLEQQGGNKFFSNNSFSLKNFICTKNGRGVVNILECQELIKRPTMYATFILWLLDKLYNELPEIGDCDKPRFVVFFDEAHLLFEDAPRAVINKVAQTVRLIRSKGVGVYFISQSLSDIPDKVLSQLSNRVQHSLRAFTPKEQRAVKVAAQTFRPNPKFDTEDIIMELGVGEALVSFLDNNGIPNTVQRAKILPPKSCLNVLNYSDRLDYNKSFYKPSEWHYSPQNGIYNTVPTPEPKKQNTNNEYRRNNSLYDGCNTGLFGSMTTGLLRGLLGRY